MLDRTFPNGKSKTTHQSALDAFELSVYYQQLIQVPRMFKRERSYLDSGSSGFTVATEISTEKHELEI